MRYGQRSLENRVIVEQGRITARDYHWTSIIDVRIYRFHLFHNDDAQIHASGYLVKPRFRDAMLDLHGRSSETNRTRVTLNATLMTHAAEYTGYSQNTHQCQSIIPRLINI